VPAPESGIPRSRPEVPALEAAAVLRLPMGAGSDTGVISAAGVAAAQVWGTDKVPILAAWPQLAATGVPQAPMAPGGVMAPPRAGLGAGAPGNIPALHPSSELTDPKGKYP